jgi:hypothetical protein
LNRTIEITVDAKGDVVVETKGFTGSSCKDASRLIERGLGDVQNDIPTAEMHQAAVVPQVVRQVE